jgi:hypothetical protein
MTTYAATVSTYYTSSSKKYNYFRLIIKNIVVTAGNAWLSLTEFKLYSRTLSGSTPILQFDASSLESVGVGNQISTWSNSGSWGSSYAASGLSATGGTKPVVRQSGIYYHVEFNRNNSNYFTIPSIAMTWLNNAGSYQGITLFVVGQFQSTAGSFERWLDFGVAAANDVFWLGRISTGTTLAFEIYNGTTNVTSQLNATNYAADTNWHIWIVKLRNSASGYTIQMYMDSSTAGFTFTGATIIANRTTTLNYLGRSNWADAYLYGNIREVAIFNDALSDAEIDSFYSTLKNKWGL